MALPPFFFGSLPGMSLFRTEPPGSVGWRGEDSSVNGERTECEKLCERECAVHWLHPTDFFIALFPTLVFGLCLAIDSRPGASPMPGQGARGIHKPVEQPQLILFLLLPVVFLLGERGFWFT